MKTNLLLLFCILTISVAFTTIEPPTPVEYKTAKYILIKNSFLEPADSSISNAALLIEDKQEVEHNVGMFIGNNTYGHGCGFDYSIQFWESSKKLIQNINYSSKCEKFLNHNDSIRSLLQYCINDLETKPTHYIYNLQIPTTKSPKSLIQEFSNANLHLFFLEGNDGHSTKLTFSYKQKTTVVDAADNNLLKVKMKQNKADAVQSINAIIDSINGVTLVEQQSDIHYTMHSFAGVDIIDQAEVSLKLSSGVNHMEIRERIKTLNGEVIELSSPQHYYVQLVHPSNSLDDIKTQISKFSYVTNMFEYPKKGEL